MRLQDATRAKFDARTRERGNDYFSFDNVELFDSTNDVIESEVINFDNEAYDVTIRLNNGKWLGADCSCPRFPRGSLCKHIWATILAYDSESYPDDEEEETVQPGISQSVLDELGVTDLNALAQKLLGGSPQMPKQNSVLPGSFAKPVIVAVPVKVPPKIAPWMRQLDGVEQKLNNHVNHSLPNVGTRTEREIWFVLDVPRSIIEQLPVILFRQRDRKANGSWGTFRPLGFRYENEVNLVENVVQRELLAELVVWKVYPFHLYNVGAVSNDACKPIASTFGRLIPRLCATGSFVFSLDSKKAPDLRPVLNWDGEQPWRFSMSITEDDERQQWTITGRFEQDVLVDVVNESRSEPAAFDLEPGSSSNEPSTPTSDSFATDAEPVTTLITLETPTALPSKRTAELSDLVLGLKAGLVVFPDHVGLLAVDSSFAWLQALIQHAQITVPFSDREPFIDRIMSIGGFDESVLPVSLRPKHVVANPVPRLCVHQAKIGRQVLCYGSIDFKYGGVTILPSDRVVGRFNSETGTWIRRNLDREREFLGQLSELKVNPQSYVPSDFPQNARYQVAVNQLMPVVTALLNQGWIVEAYGKPLRRSSGVTSFSVTSSVDWFELQGEFDFDGVTADLPALLKAIRTKSDFVELGDGTFGMLPTAWLEKYGGLVTMANASEAGVRFAPSQALLLDALLAGQTRTQDDIQFRAMCHQLKEFSGIKPKSPPRTFKGQLREYQKHGLGWLNFLQTFRLGGCLADDMGLGKTVQVLSLLEARRTRRLKAGETRLPSLVVVPKSLIFNWLAEAERFTPKLKIAAYHGTSRKELMSNLGAHDVILTTYGTLRIDITQWGQQRFDIAILDEAQAIKNPQSQSAKACRLIEADHRLALSGTPVENHLGELWSLFEFLNPGILGRSEQFRALTQASKGQVDATGLQIVANGLRPFILRRTKEQVLTELPEKSEQILYCEMPPAQKKLYTELRDFYRSNLNKTIEDKGLAQSKIHVLEALLRLRQAACHPALIDKGRTKIPSAKLETLMEQLDELAGTGHKALVFSQFTSFLALVKTELDKRGTTYEYLDGKTSNRGDRVERFQTDAACTVFLISLKAGGQGLNLTAADYVFILDPWWNPAVEAQAIDRAHRIGQERNVFAYRLISRDTVEERIMELQKDKKSLAEAVITADNSLISDLTAEDLQILLS